MPSPLFSLAEMAERTGYSEWTLREAIKDGYLTCRRLGPKGRIMFTEADFTAFLKALEVTGR